MFKGVILYIISFSLLSCNNKLYLEEVDKSKFCTYFSLETNKYKKEGKEYTSAYPKINHQSNDKTSSFIQAHFYRFDYLILKTFTGLVKNDNNFDSIYLNNKFCIAISTDSFYNQFALLTSGNKKQASGKKITYKVVEVMKIASRFFYCDRIREKDTAIAYHICGGINGIDELESTQDYTVLEAFCFEAIFKSLKGKPRFITNFNNYVIKTSKENLSRFTTFKDHLQTVKNKCFAEMERDKDLEKRILKYYKSNVSNISFRIE